MCSELDKLRYTDVFPSACGTGMANAAESTSEFCIRTIGPDLVALYRLMVTGICLLRLPVSRPRTVSCNTRSLAFKLTSP